MGASNETVALRQPQAMLNAGVASMPRFLLAMELLVLYLGLPLAYRFSPVRIPALPLLWAVSGYAFWLLLRDPHFNRAQLWNASRLPASLPAILVTFAVGALLLWLGVRRFAPALEWSFVRRHPGFWAIVMVAYPILSVYPQGLLFPARWETILASAAAFAFLHIIFRNPIAPVLTFFGGILFAFRYAQTGSLATSSFEHALYGCWLFTIGLGQYFYYGSYVTIGALVRN
jgi:uncharacterized protein